MAPISLLAIDTKACDTNSSKLSLSRKLIFFNFQLTNLKLGHVFDQRHFSFSPYYPPPQFFPVLEQISYPPALHLQSIYSCKVVEFGANVTSRYAALKMIQKAFPTRP